ncbi:RcnB family protein [Salinicola peritrichatus]|uniref:RcnB family protein n=1 Tax=Salinicola peritrichatus TaxID=1267424 RepID=UPI000DA14C52|nr:RcnB family protein [Salinicola peritrichatus]
MKRRILTTSLLIAALGVTGLAQADPGHGHGHGHGNGNKHGNAHHQGGHDYQGHDSHRNWHKGGHIDSRYYRDDRYWVRDWHARHLPEPPHGHRWIRIDGDYVLAAVATGVIAAVILGH